VGGWWLLGGLVDWVPCWWLDGQVVVGWWAGWIDGWFGWLACGFVWWLVEWLVGWFIQQLNALCVLLVGWWLDSYVVDGWWAALIDGWLVDGWWVWWLVAGCSASQAASSADVWCLGITLVGWVFDSLVCWLGGLLVDSCIHPSFVFAWLTVCLIAWLPDWLTACCVSLVDGLVGWLVAWFTVCLVAWLPDWLTAVFYWGGWIAWLFVCWLASWLNGRLLDWMAGWMNGLLN
jgi:hypothetical protein